MLVVLTDAVDEELVVHCDGRVDPSHGERRGQPDVRAPATVPRLDEGGAADTRLRVRLVVMVAVVGAFGASNSPQRMST